MFKVSLTSGRNSSKSWRGQTKSTVASVAMKCSLNVAMARPPAFAIVVQGDKLDSDCLDQSTS